MVAKKSSSRKAVASSKKTARTAKKTRSKTEDLFIPAGVFLGLGLGFLLGNLVAFLFLGLGAGFIARIMYRKKA